MFLVGLTGGIATGKSTVSMMFQELGCSIIDADLIARNVVQPGRTSWNGIKREFGDSVILENGQINRTLLGQIVFSSPEKRNALNKITHPEILKTMMWSILTLFLQGNQFAIMDIPLLFESGKMIPYMTTIIVVSCSEDQQLVRLMSRNEFTEEEAKQRISSQMSLQEKRACATYVIQNSGSLEDTRQQVLTIYKRLRASRQHWKLRIGAISVVIGITAVLCSLVLYIRS